MSPHNSEVLIRGGLSIAHQPLDQGAKCSHLILEKPELGRHYWRHNSGVLHAGLNY